jgi:hypothetical protein
MSYYVLRQIMPPGRSALAHEATALALTLAATAGTIQYGPYLQSSDPDAHLGQGDETWTDELSEAKRFATFMDAMDCWKAQSTLRPFRSDGRPNRPLTAYSVQPQRIDE